MQYINLSDGTRIPAIGFGPGGCGYTPKPKTLGRFEKFILRSERKICRITNMNTRQERVYVNGIADAIKSGFRLIDYSITYGDGQLLGQAIKKSGVPRKELYITTRIGNREQRKGLIRENFFKQLNGMGVDYVDLLQFHWPVPDYYLNTWKEMEKLKAEGYVRTLGVANCHRHHLESILEICTEKPVVNQFEVHPLFTQKELIAYCKKQDIQVEAYTPLARQDDRLFRLPLLKKIGSKYGKSVAQVVLRWDIQNGCIPIVRSFNKRRQKENLSIFDFSLTDDEMRQIDAININSRLRYDPDNCDFSIL